MKFDFTPEGLAKGNFLKLKAGKKEINNARALIADGRLMEALQPMVLGLHQTIVLQLLLHLPMAI